MRVIFGAVVVGVFCVSALPGPAAGQGLPTQDTVRRVAGPAPATRLGTITDETPEAVTMRVGNATVTIPVEEIQSIEYAGRPTDFLLGSAAERAGHPEEAAERYGRSLEALKTAGESRKYLLQ